MTSMFSGSSCEVLAFLFKSSSGMELRCRSFDRHCRVCSARRPGTTASHTRACTHTYTHACHILSMIGSSCEVLAFFQIFLGHLELRCRSFDRLLYCRVCSARRPGRQPAIHVLAHTHIHSCRRAYTLNDCLAICMARLLLFCALLWFGPRPRTIAGPGSSSRCTFVAVWL